MQIANPTLLRANIKRYLGDNPWSELNHIMVATKATKEEALLTLAELVRDEMVVYSKFAYNLVERPKLKLKDF